MVPGTVGLRHAASGWLLIVIAGCLVSGGNAGKIQRVPERQPAGDAQLVSVQPAAELEGQMCQWMPAIASSSLLETFQQRRAGPEATPGNAAREAAAKRPPLRVIHDPYSAFSAVAVDPTNNQIVMTDDVQFSILAYDRLENTPPRAAMSEPKRIIRGRNTGIGDACALHIDPANGDIYVLNNDVDNELLIFSRQARGNVAPDRLIDTPHTTFGMAVDEKHQEILLTVQDDAAVVTFRKTAKGKDAPLRLLQGERTQLADPHGIAWDPNNDLIFVSNWGTVNVHKAAGSESRVGTLGRGVGTANWPVGRNYTVPSSGKILPPSITVYPRSASGNTPPLQLVQGPKTQLSWPTALAFDAERSELYVANDPTHSIAVFKSDAKGDVAPIRVLQGPKTLIKNPTGVYVDLKNDELWVANFGSRTATVYKRNASGDTPPLRVIRSAPANAPVAMLGHPAALTYDSKREEILVSN